MPGIHPVAVKNEDQQALMAPHRGRAHWMQSRTARINGMRGLLAEFGVTGATGAKRFLKDLHPLLTRVAGQLPERVRRTLAALWDQVHELEQRIETIETELEGIAVEQPALQALLTIPGIGLLTATALFATGDIHAFKSGRQLACWLGLTPWEHSSGGHRRLGRISKQGDPYVRMLFVHGARSALNTARRLDHASKSLTQLQAWALQRARSAHSNKATLALERINSSESPGRSGITTEASTVITRPPQMLAIPHVSKPPHRPAACQILRLDEGVGRLVSAQQASRGCKKLPGQAHDAP